MSQVSVTKLALILTGFTAVTVGVMYPIYWYPKMHEDEYSKLLSLTC